MYIAAKRPTHADAVASVSKIRSRCAPLLTGIISRDEAENQLRDKWAGSFLVRVSDKIWGYVISYRCVDQSDGASVKFKHFLIDADTSGYRLFGAANFVHHSLSNLVEYHSVSWCNYFTSYHSCLFG